MSLLLNITLTIIHLVKTSVFAWLNTKSVTIILDDIYYIFDSTVDGKLWFLNIVQEIEGKQLHLLSIIKTNNINYISVTFFFLQNGKVHY